MKTRKRTIEIVVSCVLLVCSAAVSDGHKRRARKPRLKTEPATAQKSIDGPVEVHLKLCDGTIVVVDEAWESPQGTWYQRAGVSHLLPPERVKAIERVSTVIKTEDQVETSAPKTVAATTGDGPAWIYLVGGARVEADEATESTAGVWYRRGTLSIFVERPRVDHVERESPEVALASANSKERGWTTGNPRIDGMIRQSGARYAVDPYLIFCVMEQESHFNTRALSPKGARGLMQLMPGTSARFGIRKPSDPAQNIAGGTRYLRQLIDQFNGRIELVLASYNAGEGAVMKFGGRVPPYRETRDYVKRISYRYRRSKAVAVVPGASVVRVNAGN